ncbi:MAG: sensor histidine kinase [Selenomonadaceae bacterium]|nr:sensor histidine kinase [Selenomonadaceae bacterium]
MEVIFLAVVIVVIQASDSYLRYVSFRNEMTADEKIFLARRFLLYGVISAIFYGLIFKNCGINSPLYKIILIAGWIPWLIVFMFTVKRNFLKHMFIFGMSEVWATTQHSLSAIIVVSLFSNSEQQIVLTHAILYPILFVIFSPVSRKFFAKLMPPKNFFVDYGRLIAFLPLITISGTLILWMQEPTIHSWAERFSRIYIPFVFFFFYSYVLNSTKRLNEKQQLNQNLRQMKRQIDTLSEYNRLMQENREKVAVMRHDLRHSYRLIHTMLQENQFDAAKNYVGKQEQLLSDTFVKNFCVQPLINSALSFYIGRAESLGIKVRHKINLPDKFSTDENDFALLVSNLLENAINACSKQNFGEKIISITLQNVQNQFVLEIFNTCDPKTINFDEKNYPQASDEDHGLGMASIKLFSEKYGAYTDFFIEGDLFKVTMYWRIAT